MAPMSPGPDSPAPASFATPPQTSTFTAPPSVGLQPPGPVEGGEEEPGTLGTVWHYAWEYGLEVVPVAAPTRGFLRAYDEGSMLGMGLRRKGDGGLFLSERAAYNQDDFEKKRGRGSFPF